MAKRQSFGDKIRKRKQERNVMAKLVMAERKSNGHYRFREKIVPMADVQKELAAAR